MIGSSDMMGFLDSGQPLLRDQWGGVSLPGSLLVGGAQVPATTVAALLSAGSVALPGSGSKIYLPYTSGQVQILFGDSTNGFVGVQGVNSGVFFMTGSGATAYAKVASSIAITSTGQFQWSNDSNANSGTFDAGFARTAAGSVSVTDNANGKALGISMLTEVLTIAVAATSTTTIQKPANSIILGVSVFNTVAVTCTSTYTVGDSTSAARFSTAAVSKVLSASDKGTKAGAYYNATAEGIIITPDSTPSDATGRVRVTIYYINVTPPTS